MHTHRVRRFRLPALLMIVTMSVTAVVVGRAYLAPGAAALTGVAGPARLSANPSPDVTASPSAGTAPTATTSSETPAESPSATPSTSSSPATSASTTALRTLRRLVDRTSDGATSVAAYDMTTGQSVSAGATNGMVTASVVKLQLLESLLLSRQRAGRGLSDDEVDTVTAMIEQSDNAAAETVFWTIGGRDAVVSLEKPLGLSRTKTDPGADDYWGLTTTSAQQEIVLLRNLVKSDSPLSGANRRFVLRLMRHVEDDQAWGVSAAASSGTTPAVKNGWLGVSDDGDRWAVNSAGVITVAGHTVLVAVFTQHGDDFASGVERVEQLARAVVAALP